MPIDWGVVARAIHVIGVVVWAGGLWLLTTLLSPGMKNEPPQEWLREFDVIEHRFAPQARIAVAVVLLSVRYGFTDTSCGTALMVGAWLLFAAPLYVIESLIVRRTIHRRAGAAPEAILSWMLWMHRAMLTLSLLAIFAAVGGNHGLF